MNEFEKHVPRKKNETNKVWDHPLQINKLYSKSTFLAKHLYAD